MRDPPLARAVSSASSPAATGGLARDRGPAGSAEGFTLLEAAISVTLLTVLVGGTLIVVYHSQRSFAEELQLFTIDQMGRKVMDRLSEEIRAADPATVLPLVISDSSTLSFQKVTGYSNGAKLLGSTITVGLQMEGRELPNGKDDNGDGRADEAAITVTQAGSTPLQIAGHILGLRFNSTGWGIQIAVDIGLVDASGSLIQRTFTQSVSFRND